MNNNVCGDTKLVYQSTWNFELDGRAWALLPLNVGYMELIDVSADPATQTQIQRKYCKKSLIDKTQTAVSELVRLTITVKTAEPDDNGVTAVDICKDITGAEGFTIYSQEEFKTEFGEPCTPLPDTPCPPDPSPGADYGRLHGTSVTL